MWAAAGRGRPRGLAGPRAEGRGVGTGSHPPMPATDGGFVRLPASEMAAAAADETRGGATPDVHSLAGLVQVSDQGEAARDEPQLTFRASVVGVLVGGLMCFSNMYFGLQTGWITAGSLQSTILGFGLFKLLRPCLRRSFGPLENVALQTVAVATATMPLAGGFVGIIPALAMLPPAAGGPRHLSGVELCGWSAALAFFGAFVAVPLRRQTILREQLRFPSGTATAQIIRVLHAGSGDSGGDGGAVDGKQQQQQQRGEQKPTHAEAETEPLVHATIVPSSSLEAPPLRSRSLDDDLGVGGTTSSGHRGVAGRAEAEEEEEAEGGSMMRAEWALLAAGFGLSGGYTLLSHFVPTLKNLPVLTWLGYPAATALFWTLQPSLSYVGQGIIMGPRTTISMLLGALLGWAWLGPAAESRGWTTAAADGGGGGGGECFPRVD
jgi:OPT family oligopeptide transporter